MANKANTMADHEVYDLLIVVYATASMTQYLEALNTALPEIISLSALTGCFERIGVVAYRDYCAGPVTEWTGWCSPFGIHSGPGIVHQDVVLEMVQNIKTVGNSDWPEACKTGLAKEYSEMRSDATTIIMLYTDAPPHLREVKGSNYKRETAALNNIGAYGGTRNLFVDWVSAAKALSHEGPKRGIVFSMITDIRLSDYSPYLYLATITGGSFFAIRNTNSDNISQLSIAVLLAWMGAGKQVTEYKAFDAQSRRYKNTKRIHEAIDEDSDVVSNYFSTTFVGSVKHLVAANIYSAAVKLSTIPRLIANVPKPSPMTDFSKRYVQDENYRNLVVDQLRQIISFNVSAMSVNPVFGTLWRAVCNDRSNEARDGLITLFSLKIQSISEERSRERIRTWLEESYNYVGEIQDMIAEVIPSQRFPVLYYDPTAELHTESTSSKDEDGDNRPLNEFKRAELLEIGRSCDYRILRRLGKVLTRLSYVDREDKLPKHIREAKRDTVALIPLALVNSKYNSRFWKVLLHTILPGTKLAPRPAALLAALALRMAITPLRDAADQELLSARDRWNNIDVPETWNISCLGLLLDADRDYEARVAKGITARHGTDDCVLTPEDRGLFKTLIDYKMLEMNLQTTLQAKIGWRPEKALVALGSLVVCQTCRFPRSVTMMSSNGICGLCCDPSQNCTCHACTRTEDFDKRLRTNVEYNHKKTTRGHWVECSRSDCQAQYVVYNPKQLRVDATCFFCRHGNGKSKLGRAPVVECSKCLSRIIWPVEYRPKDLNPSEFECTACSANMDTVISQDTSARLLMSENGIEWLLKSDHGVIDEPFNGRSLFFTAAHCDLSNFAETTQILPNIDTKITLSGKVVINLPEVRATLQKWVGARSSESGTCSLCFSDIRKAKLQRACGRSGCHQLVCGECKKGWYGINQRGRIINVAALSCPFCRRPAHKAISSFGLSRLGDLRAAVDESGEWVYGWCNSCGFAKRHVERDCAAGVPPELTRWRCDECRKLEANGAQDEDHVVTMECPGCHVTTEKMGGCDHITCICGTHWCYSCETELEEALVHVHMQEAHGGLWGINDEDEWDFDNDIYT